LYTPYRSHKEELSVFLRTVDTSSKEIKFEEYFLGFFHVSEITGRGLAETSLDVPLSHCRGQTHDNGSNMKEKKSVTEARVVPEYPSVHVMHV
jgi:hypothetical protein